MTTPAPYDQVADRYDSSRRWPPEVEAAVDQALYNRLAQVAVAGRVVRLVEVGAGTGRMLVGLAARGVWCVGLDLSAAMLQQIRRKAAAGNLPIHAVQGDAHRLPFPDGHFDAALLVHVVHLVEDWRAVLVEAMRVVRPGGLLLLGDDVGNSADENLIAARWQELVTAAGGKLTVRPTRSGTTAAAAAWLTARGYPVVTATLATWQESRPPQLHLDRLRERLFSGSWSLPDTVLEDALAALEPDLRARFGSLDTPLPVEHLFRLFCARLPQREDGQG